MAFTCTVDRERRLGTVTVSGTVGVEELVQIVLTLLDDPAWEPGFDVLWDGTRITDFVASEEDMRTVAGTSREHMERIGTGRTAIVVTGDKHAELVELFTALAKDPRRERRIFRTAEQARAWLDS